MNDAEGALAQRAGGLRVVAFVERYLQPGQTFVFRQMTQLPGCDVRFVARWLVPGSPYPHDSVALFGRRSGQRPTRSGWYVNRLLQRLLRSYAVLRPGERRSLRACLSSPRPDVVHAHWAPDAMLVAPLCEELAIPLVVQFHGYDASQLIHDPVYARSLAGLFRRASLVLTVSGEMRRRVLALGCPEGKITAHYIGVPEECFAVRRPARSGRMPFTLLQLGRLDRFKGCETTLRALVLIRREIPDARLRLVGSGPLRERLETLVRELGLAAAVDLPGWRDPSGVLAELSRADAVVVPSETEPRGPIEGLPTAAVEGLAAGVPVIATRHGGLPEAVDYGDPEWLIPEGDAAALAERVVRLASNPGLWAELSRRGRRRAREHFHLPTQNQLLVAMYARLLPSSAPSR